MNRYRTSTKKGVVVPELFPDVLQHFNAIPIETQLNTPLRTENNSIYLPSPCLERLRPSTTETARSLMNTLEKRPVSAPELVERNKEAVVIRRKGKFQAHVSRTGSKPVYIGKRFKTEEEAYAACLAFVDQLDKNIKKK